MSLRVEQIFSDRAARWRENAALEIGDRRVSYGDLDQLSSQLARHLTRVGVARDSIVAIATGDIEFFVIAVLAVLKAGGAYLGVDTRYPVERVTDILTEASPTILLADADFPEQLIPTGLRVVRDIKGSARDGTGGGAMPPADGNADDTACVFYTSGSTGRPKGIEVTHRGIPELVGDAAFIAFGPDDRIGQAANFAFDAINFELWGALLNGGCVVHVPKKALFSSTTLGAFLVSKGITVIWLTTSLFNALAAGNPAVFVSLKTLVIGGEAADPHAIARVFHSGMPPHRLVNAYGPTEATTFATWHEVTSRDVAAGRIPIGKPIQGMSVHVCDRHLAPVPAGEPGELLIGGPGLAKGYLRQPALTEAAFIFDRSEPKSPRRLYRTGDLCRALADGSIEYLGRIDDQVKIRGFRVEPSEVAAIMRTLPGIDDAVILTRKTSFNTHELLAFVRGENLPPMKDLRSAMAKLVPDYMLPSDIRAVEEFPLTSNGKLDRTALFKKISSTAPSPSIGRRLDEIEAQIAEIWQRTLKRSDITRDDEFHDAGGDSLSVMNLALEIETTYDVILDLDDFAPPLTIARLAAQLRNKLGRETAASDSEVPSAKVFAIAYPWTAGRMPDEIGQALSGGQWQHLHLPLNYFLSNEEISIEGMAAHLERLVYARAPQGPYVLYGHCFTGLLAYEVAQRLTAAGHSVALIVIVDSYPSVDRPWWKRIGSLAARVVTFDLDLKKRFEKFCSKRKSGASNKFQDHIRDACSDAASRYRPRPYGGRVEFFRHANEAALAQKDQTAWRRLVRGQFTEHVVNMHDREQVTAESVRSGYAEIATKLNQIRLAWVDAASIALSARNR